MRLEASDPLLKLLEIIKKKKKMSRRNKFRNLSQQQLGNPTVPPIADDRYPF